MKRELRYTVLKNKDVEKYLDGDDILLLVALCDKVTIGRYRDGKPAMQCVVVEKDWPEYEPTWDAIGKRVDAELSGEQPQDREIKVVGWHWPKK